MKTYPDSLCASRYRRRHNGTDHKPGLLTVLSKIPWKWCEERKYRRLGTLGRYIDQLWRKTGFAKRQERPEAVVKVVYQAK